MYSYEEAIILDLFAEIECESDSLDLFSVSVTVGLISAAQVSGTLQITVGDIATLEVSHFIVLSNLQEQVDLVEGENTVNMETTISDVELWWPAGVGPDTRTLYELGMLGHLCAAIHFYSGHVCW